MNFTKNAKFLASEKKVSKKGNEYSVVSVMCGAELVSVMADCEISADFGQDVTILFDLNTKYNSLKIVSVELSTLKKAI